MLHLPPHGEAGIRGVVLLAASPAERYIEKRNDIISRLPKESNRIDGRDSDEHSSQKARFMSGGSAMKCHYFV